MSGFDFSLLSKGGPMMAVILLMAAIMVVLAIERTLYLHRGQIRARAFIEGIKNTLQKRRLVEALTICEETPGPVAAVVKAALLHTREGAERMRHAVRDAAIVEMPALERRLGAIAAIAQVAPLVGLLGTLLGMITTFHAFMQGGQYATAGALAGGLWQALAATAGGLLVGIPAHLAHHFLGGRVRSIVRDVEWSANEIMDYLLSEYAAGGEEQGERGDAAGKPGAAGKPDVAEEPGAAGKPGAAGNPDGTGKPGAAEELDGAGKPDADEKPDGAGKPGGAEEPGGAGKPGGPGG